jgi:hypothetical protein
VCSRCSISIFLCILSTIGCLLTILFCPSNYELTITPFGIFKLFLTGMQLTYFSHDVERLSTVNDKPATLFYFQYNILHLIFFKMSFWM